MPRWIVLIAAVFLSVSFGASAQDTATPDSNAYTVQSGDTLGIIAARFDTTVAEIMRLNELTNPQLIVIGQTLRIPTASTEPPSSASEASVIPFDETPISTFEYGIEAFFDNQDAASVTQQIAGLGMRWAKVRVSWRALETNRGSIDYARLDAIIDALQAGSLNILLTLTDAPDWARSSSVENGPPDDLNDYAVFVGALAARYSGRVRAYEIWNEPNLRREWNSTTHRLSSESYADLLRGAYAAVKAADPGVTVVSAGLAPTGFNDGVNAVDDRQFLQRLYELGLADMSDAIGAHPFGFANPPDSWCCAAPDGVLTHYGQPSFYFLDTLDDYHELMIANADLNTPIWVTQFGWGSSEDTAAPPRNSLYVRYNSLEKQAEYSARGFELGVRSDFVAVMILYNLNSCVALPENAEACYYSLIAPSGQPRPAYQSISALFATALEG